MYFDPPIVPFSSGGYKFSQWVLYRSPVVLCFDRGHPFLGNFSSTIPVDVIRTSYLDGFLDPTCVPVRILINKLDLDGIEVALVDVFRNGGSLGTGDSYIPVVFFDPLLHGSPCCPNITFSALARNPVDNAILSFGLTK